MYSDLTIMMIGMFFAAFVSMFLIWHFQHKASVLEAINNIYRSHWEELCNQMLNEIQKDGHCRLVVTREQIEEMMEYLCIEDKAIKKNYNTVMVVYAYDRSQDYRPWIYGVYTDRSRGFEVIEKMQMSEEYGHLTWSNNVVKVDNKVEVSL